MMRKAFIMKTSTKIDGEKRSCIISSYAPLNLYRATVTLYTFVIILCLPHIEGQVGAECARTCSLLYSGAEVPKQKAQRGDSLARCP